MKLSEVCHDVFADGVALPVRVDRAGDCARALAGARKLVDLRRELVPYNPVTYKIGGYLLEAQASK